MSELKQMELERLRSHAINLINRSTFCTIKFNDNKKKRKYEAIISLAGITLSALGESEAEAVALLIRDTKGFRF